MHNDGKSTTGGDFRSYSMSGSDGAHLVKVEFNGQTVIFVTIPSPYTGDEVKEALRDGFNEVCQVYILPLGLSFIKNNKALVGFTPSRGVLPQRTNSCSGSVPWCYYL